MAVAALQALPVAQALAVQWPRHSGSTVTVQVPVALTCSLQPLALPHCQWPLAVALHTTGTLALAVALWQRLPFYRRRTTVASFIKEVLKIKKRGPKTPLKEPG